MRGRGGESRERSKGIQRRRKKKKKETIRRDAPRIRDLRSDTPHRTKERAKRESRANRETSATRDKHHDETDARARMTRRALRAPRSPRTGASEGEEARGPSRALGCPTIAESLRSSGVTSLARLSRSDRFESTSARNGGTRLDKCREFLIRPYRDFSLVHSYVIIYAI